MNDVSVLWPMLISGLTSDFIPKMKKPAAPRID